MRHRAITSIFGVCMLLCSPAWAQHAVVEAEPNDTPGEAIPVSGAGVLIGSMSGHDQDAWLWTVSDEDAQKRWTFELRGVPARLTIVEIVRLEYGENGTDIVGMERLFKMGTRDGLTPSIHESLLFEPGEYVLGIAGAGGGEGGIYRPPSATLSFGPDDVPVPQDAEPGAYRLIITEGERLPTLSKPKSKDTKEAAHKTRIGRSFAALTFDESSWYRFDFNEKQAEQRWDLAMQVPMGRKMRAELFDEAGDSLATSTAGRDGKLAFRDLAPPVGSWWVEMHKQVEDGYIQVIGTEAVGVQVTGEEAEPNGKPAIANQVDLSQPLTGRISESHDSDFFRFSVDEALSDQVLELRLDNAPGQKLEFCLLSPKGARLQCRKGAEAIVLPDLILAPGEWGLSVSRGTAGTEYSINLTPQGDINPGLEAEPNDALANASSVPSKNRIKGRFSGNESDYYRFVVADEPQLWRFQVIGDGIQEVGYLDASGHQNQRARPPNGQRRVRLDNVYLLPGVHHLLVRGRDGGNYTVLARPVGQPDPNGEREPNNDTRQMQHLAIGQTRTGLLSEKDDKDFYRFFLANHDHIRLTIKPAADGSVQPSLYWYTSPVKQTHARPVGEPTVLEGVFPPGDYYFSLSATKTSDAEYTVSLERLDRFSCSVDCEPNDNAGSANTLPPDFVVEGIAGDWRDLDVYALPVRDEQTEWKLETDYRSFKVARKWAETSIAQYDSATESYTASVPAGEQYFLFISSSQIPSYRIDLDYAGSGKAAGSAGQPAVTTALQLDATEVAAYRQNAQRIDGRLVLTNKTSAPGSVDLEITTSDHRWEVGLDRATVVVPAGQDVTVPVTVGVPADVWADRSVTISARAVRADGAQSETSVDVLAGRETPLANPGWGWTIPESLRGGFNVARPVFGGKLIGNYDSKFGTNIENLFNDVDVRGQGMELRGGWNKTQNHRDVIVELAGAKPVEVVGTAINLFHRATALRDLKVLEMALSDDGVNFTTVLEKELDPVKTDQYFVLDQPRSARFARLRMKHGFSGAAGEQLSVAEWKVIARPGTDVSNGQGFNLADLDLGGHVVYSRPTTSVRWDQALLDSDSEERRIKVNAGQEYEFVVALHHNRAAQITKLEWDYTKASYASTLHSEVRIAASTESAFGPWKSLGTWPLKGQGQNTVINLDQPEWARYIKFTAPAIEKRASRSAPDAVRIWERATDADYRSILAEWGYASRQSHYEAMQELVIEQPLQAAGNDSRGRAAAMVLGQPVGGAVSLGKHEHWYRFSVPAGQNTVTLLMNGDPTVRTTLHMEDAVGNSVRLSAMDRESTTSSHQYEATVEPGRDYFLRVEEPPRNVIFTWDTSASVLPYIPTIYNALIAFAEDVVPGRDAVNLLPFGRGPLLRDWYGEPYILQTVLNDYLKKESSSSGEAALRRSSKELSKLPGTKAIVVITDAATVRDAKVWDEFEKVRPRVFGIGVAGSGGAKDEQDLFQNWADVNAGHFKHINYGGEMEVAFDRVATMLRRPAEYTLVAKTEYREDPGPGYLSVISGDGGSGTGSGNSALGGAIELILDASGSMWQKLDGRFRIEIAKEVLTEAIRDYIPAGTPTALRVFGNREPNSCRTDLEIKLQALNPESAAATINAINPQSLAKTPIAASLAKIESDLRSAEGSKTVVLVTDGKETCEGQPEDVIRKMRDKGIDITLNIVGFAIGDAALEQSFADWAELGGGRYFSANDKQGLSDAIATALQVTYSVYDESGTKITTGTVGGDPVELEAGEYRIIVASSPQREFDQVTVTGSRPTVLTLE